MKNYYHILGLSLDSNPDAQLISQCHKALVLKDKKLGEKKVREINEAYEVLKDKKKKKKYDEDLKNYLNQQNKSSGTTDNPKQNNYKTDKDFNDKYKNLPNSLFLGILLFPAIGAWFTLKKDTNRNYIYRKRTRILSFVWAFVGVSWPYLLQVAKNIANIELPSTFFIK